MSMQTHIRGFRPPDERWKQMKRVYEACKDAKIDVPQKVSEFFCHENPANLPGIEIDISAALHLFEDGACSGYTLDLKALPPDLMFIRFYNSW